MSGYKKLHPDDQLYINGKCKLSYDSIITMTKFFGVPADYLLFGIKLKISRIF